MRDDEVIIKFIDREIRIANKVYNYIKDHKGRVVIARALHDLGISEGEWADAVKFLRERGKIE